MANRVRLFPILPLLALVLAPAVVRAEEPVASAPIPPPVSAPSATVPNPPGTMTHLKPATPAPQKPALQRKVADSTAHKKSTHRRIARSQAHRKAEPRPHLAQAALPPAAPPRYYRSVPAMPELAEGPSLPPPWYDWGRPPAVYPYPGPRRPMPPW